MKQVCDSKRAGLDELRQFQLRQEERSPAEQIQDKLTQLEAFIRQLESTPNGRAELQARRECFGECRAASGETTAHYYGRLRSWLDRVPRGA